MNEGQLIGIFLASAKGGPLHSVPQVEAVAGRGLTGDRYAAAAGTFSKSPPDVAPDYEITLIESEALEAARRDYQLELPPDQSRRNLLTRGVALNHLVQREFRIGTVLLRGVRLCEPCGHLEKLTLPGIRAALVHRGGLRAQILESGTLRVGDAVRLGKAAE